MIQPIDPRVAIDPDLQNYLDYLAEELERTQEAITNLASEGLPPWTRVNLFPDKPNK